MPGVLDGQRSRAGSAAHAVRGWNTVAGLHFWTAKPGLMVTGRFTRAVQLPKETLTVMQRDLGSKCRVPPPPQHGLPSGAAFRSGTEPAQRLRAAQRRLLENAIDGEILKVRQVVEWIRLHSESPRGPSPNGHSSAVCCDQHGAAVGPYWGELGVA